MSGGVDFDSVPFEKQNKKKWVPNNNNNTSQQALDLTYESLNTNLIKFEKTKDWSIIKTEICQKIQPQALLQSFSMYAHINDHKNWTQTIIRLNKLLTHLSTYESNSEEDTLIQDYAHNLIDSLITKEMKVVYRALNNLRGAITNPMLRLLTTIVKFGNGKYVDIFTSYFDFSLPSLNKILTPHKNELNNKQESVMDEKQYENSLRYNFIKFFTDLLSYAPVILRKDLITENNKIMVNLSKYISKVDSDSCTLLLINTFIDKIIKETSYKKATKCRIFHEFLLLNILKKYQNTETSLECKKKIMEFFLLLFTNSELGMVFENSKPWYDLGNTENNTISVNDKKYKLNNKYIFNTISKFKPWEDEMQLNTLIRILHNIPELVAPYVNQLNYINGNNEPKMTSFWIGQTLTLNKIINLPIPEIVLKEEDENLNDGNEEEYSEENKNMNGENNYSLQILTDIILPPSITLTNLRQYINNDSQFIKHLGCQCVVFILKKLNLITDFLKQKSNNNINFANDLINQIQTKLPDLHEYLKIVDSIYNEDEDKNNTNLLLVSELTLVLSLYTNTFTNLNNQFKLNNKNIYNKLIMKGSNSGTSEEVQLNGLELNIIDKYLELQELNDSYKWWNKNNSELSLFTSLLKMSVTNDSGFTNKIVKILENLIKSHKLFNEEKLLASPIISLLESVIKFKENDLSNVWKLIDQSVQRTVTTPYKYIDISVKYEFCSPLMCCIIEQLPFFIKEDTESVEKKWVVFLMQRLSSIGDIGLKQLLLSCDILDNSLIETVWNEHKDLKLEDSISNLNEFCDAISCINQSNKEQSDIIIQTVDNFLQKISVSDKQKLTKSHIFDNIFVSENDNEILSDILLVLQRNDIIVNLQDKQNIFNHWVQLLSSKDYKLILAIINQFDKDSFTNFVSNENFNIEQLESNECLLLIFFKLFEFKLIDNETSKDIIYQILSKCGSLIPEEYFDLLSEQINLSDLINDKNVLINSKQFLETLVSTYPSESLLYFKNCFNNDQNQNSISMTIFFASLLSNIEDSEITNQLSKSVYTLIENKDEKVLPQILTFVAEKIDFNDSENNEKLLNFLTYLTTESKIKFTAPVVSFITKLLTTEKINVDTIITWYYKAFLYINKKSAIIKETEILNSQFLQLFSKLSELIAIINPWEYIPKIILNTSLEIILLQKWAFKKEIIQFFVSLCNSSYDDMFETNKAIQFIFNNESNPFKISQKKSNNTEIINLTAVMLSSFYYKNIKLNSDVNIALQFVENYEGTTTLKDRIFYNIMQSIESKTSVSWTQRIGSWDFVDIGQDFDQDEEFEDEKLIVKEKELLSININRKMVTNTINNYRFVDNKNIPSECIDFAKWDQILTEETLIAENNAVIYETRFIMLLILQNKELVNNIDIDEDEEIQVSRFNFKSLIRTDLFALIIVSLSYQKDENSMIAYQILKHMVNTLPKTEEENVKLKIDLMIKIFLKKILFTFQEDKKLTPSEFAPPIFWYMISQISFIILEPKHFLYEQVYKWVLSKPKLVKYELPIMNIFINFQIKNQDFENINKCLNWLLRNMNNGLKTIEDINYLKLIKMFDFMLNLSNNCYSNKLTLSNINRFVYNIQKIVNDYSIITRYGVLSSLEARKYVNDFKIKHKNFNNSLEEYKEYLMLLQDSLNIKELAIRFGPQLNSNKRLSEWTEDDGLRMIKRVCK
ncbi:hypothetical protein ACO0SA_001914 [Hanseniaspora valbyensis]